MPGPESITSTRRNRRYVGFGGDTVVAEVVVEVVAEVVVEVVAAVAVAEADVEVVVAVMVDAPAKEAAGAEEVAAAGVSGVVAPVPVESV
jgi:hypothetical protein